MRDLVKCRFVFPFFFRFSMIFFFIPFPSVYAVLPQDSLENLSEVEKMATLSLLWSEAKYNFVYFDQVPELDWDKAYRETIPLVMATKSDAEYFSILQRFMALLHDGHTAVLLPDYARSGKDSPALRVGEIEGKPIVVAVDKSRISEVPLGSEVLTIDGQNIWNFVNREIIPYVAASTDYVGYGIQPDLRVEPTIESISESRDLILEKGIAELKRRLRQN